MMTRKRMSTVGSPAKKTYFSRRKDFKREHKSKLLASCRHQYHTKIINFHYRQVTQEFLIKKRITAYYDLSQVIQLPPPLPPPPNLKKKLTTPATFSEYPIAGGAFN